MYSHTPTHPHPLTRTPPHTHTPTHPHPLSFTHTHILQIYAHTRDENFQLIIVDYGSEDMDVEEELKKSSLKRFAWGSPCHLFPFWPPSIPHSILAPIHSSSHSGAHLSPFHFGFQLSPFHTSPQLSPFHSSVHLSPFHTGSHLSPFHSTFQVGSGERDRGVLPQRRATSWD